MNSWKEILKYSAILYMTVVYVGKTKQFNEDVIKLDEDYKKNITLPCNDYFLSSIKWIGPGKRNNTILPNGNLFLSNLEKQNSGEYICTSVSDGKDIILSKILLKVRTPPAAVSNVTVIPSTIHALIKWEIKDDGGYPITNITIRYRQTNIDDVWHVVNSDRISFKTSQRDIYKLNPNSTYLFEIWASNKLGPGELTSINSTTLHDSHEIELARILLQGAETFDTRAWLAAVAIVMTTLVILTMVTCCVLYRDCQIPLRKKMKDDPERIELIPKIILNPACYEDFMWSKYYSNDISEDDDDCTTYFLNRQGAKAIKV